MRRRWWFGASSGAIGLVVLFGSRSHFPTPSRLFAPNASAKTAGSSAGLGATPAPALTHEVPAPIEEAFDDAHGFRAPSGEPSGVSCAAARSIVLQTRTHLAYEPSSPAPKLLVEGTADWLDPHGLWSAAPDSPVDDVLGHRAREILRELEAPSANTCPGAHDVGTALVAWVGALRKEFDRARAATLTATAPSSSESGLAAASEAIFENGSVTRPARALATILGRKVGAAERAIGPASAEFAAAARARFFPDLDADGWTRVVLAAAVRAYVPLIDPHGAWAPADEESSVYEVDLEASPPERLWEKSARTALGLRIDAGGVAPLASGDVILALGGVATAGLPLEQIEQLALAVADGKASAEAIVLRGSDPTPIALKLHLHATRGDGDDTHVDGLAVERIPYGNDLALVIAIPDVHDDLGDELARTLLRERQRDGARIVGVALDLRGNGGGSTDGAIAALGLFLPGVSLFPMRRRDGSVETDRAPEPPMIDRWAGPIATLVDGDTASAAEMIAGALAAYRRGPSAGSLTFGKGCAQEYLDDDASTGVLRLTTLIYALPDGAPVQRIGLAPTYRVPFAPLESERHGSTRDREREASMPHAPPTWRGPDVRDATAARRAENDVWLSPWPAHGGAVGPCKGADVCRALRAIGTSLAAKRTAKAK